MNEDDLVVRDDIFAVIDGATSLVKYTDPITGRTGGRIAADVVKSSFMVGEPASLRNAALKANKAIARKMKYCNIPNGKEYRWAASVAAVRLSGDMIEIFSIGDCRILAITKEKEVKFIAEPPDHDAGLLKEWVNYSDQGFDIATIGTLMSDKFRAHRKMVNIEYGDLNGENEAQEFFKEDKIPTEGLRSIVLFTDGFELPCIKQDDKWNEFVSLYEAGGLIGILSKVRERERCDPEFKQFPRFKLHDDAAAIALDFN